MRPLVFTALAAFLLSILTTWWAQFLTRRVSLIGDFLGLQRTENAGVAFGIDLPPVALVILIGLVLAGAIVLALQQRRTTVERIAFGLIIGGALGNIVDRIGDGRVTDILQFGRFPWLFNVADSAITIGAALLLIDGMWPKKHSGT